MSINLFSGICHKSVYLSVCDSLYYVCSVYSNQTFFIYTCDLKAVNLGFKSLCNIKMQRTEVFYFTEQNRPAHYEKEMFRIASQVHSTTYA
jgi:hypothetical protein